MIANDGATTVEKRRYLWLKRSSPFIIILHGSYHYLLLQDLLSCCKKLFMSLTHQRLHFVYVQLDALFNSLNVKGIRERSLQKELEKLYEKIRFISSPIATPTSSPALSLICPVCAKVSLRFKQMLIISHLLSFQIDIYAFLFL